MEMLDFLCPENGLPNGKPTKIKMPAVCCGKPTVLGIPNTYGSFSGCTTIVSRCSDLYPDLGIKLFGKNGLTNGVMHPGVVLLPQTV